jgi:hypothetical protein
MELHQKALLEKRSFFLLNNKLKLYLKDTEGEYENYISYENIKSESQICCRKNSKLLFITIATGSLAISIFVHSIITDKDIKYFLLAGAIAVFWGFLYQTKQQNYIVVETFDRKRIIFLRNRPNRQALDTFLSQLWLQRRKYLRKKYFYINPNQDLQQETERLRWLLEQNAITKAEFKYAKDDWIIEKSQDQESIIK